MESRNGDFLSSKVINLRGHIKMNNYRIIKSQQDESVNFIKDADDGKIESRYVRRVHDYFIAYLSSHTGCRLACRFCHLTATGQTGFTSVSYDDYIEQAKRVLEWYFLLSTPPANHVHFNFMARGEPLLNDTMLTRGPELISHLNSLAPDYFLKSASCRISTIMPKQFNKSLVDVIGLNGVIPYYSLYGMDEGFRKRWLPNAMPVMDALDRLKHWQDKSGEHIVIHGAFIKDVNDRYQDMHAICDALEEKQIKAKMNVVRFNSPDDIKYIETDETRLKELLSIFEQRMKDAKLLAPGSRIVPRVGYDVKASCGMFVNE